MSKITSETLMAEKVKEAGHTCKKFGGHRGYAGSPIFRRSQEDCFYLTPGGTAVCNEINSPSSNAALCYLIVRINTLYYSMNFYKKLS